MLTPATVMCVHEFAELNEYSRGMPCMHLKRKPQYYQNAELQCFLKSKNLDISYSKKLQYQQPFFEDDDSQFW